MEKNDDLFSLEFEDLCKVFLAEVHDSKYTLEDLANRNYLDFDSETLVASRNKIQQKTFNRRLRNLKTDIISEIQAARKRKAEQKKIEELYQKYKDKYNQIPNNSEPLHTLEEFYEWNTDADGINYDNLEGDINNFIEDLESIPQKNQKN